MAASTAVASTDGTAGRLSGDKRVTVLRNTVNRGKGYSMRRGMLHATGQLRCPVKLARLLIFGALNWSVQWFDIKKEAGLDDLTEAAMALFIGNEVGNE